MSNDDLIADMRQALADGCGYELHGVHLATVLTLISPPPPAPLTAVDLCQQAAGLVSGDRAATHGDKLENHRNIAALWSAYLEARDTHGTIDLSPQDVALMMALLKIARTLTGSHNADDYRDLIGYAAIAGEIAEGER